MSHYPLNVQEIARNKLHVEECITHLLSILVHAMHDAIVDFKHRIASSPFRGRCAMLDDRGQDAMCLQFSANTLWSKNTAQKIADWSLQRG